MPTTLSAGQVHALTAVVTRSDGATVRTTNIATILTAALPGDYNGDGTVDAADYVVWRKNDGTQQEYSTWRAQFGQTSGSGTAAIENSVPEPSSLSLLTLAAPALMLRRRRHTACAPTAMSLYRIADQIKGAIR